MLKTLVGRTRSRQSRRVDAPDFPSKTSGPRISIVTVSYNSAATLAKTIESVANQNYLNLEHVVVDGKSTDGSLDIIRANADKISKWISEDDRGIYHAMNKGWSLSTGDYVGFLNSDDTLTGPDVISQLARRVDQSQADAVYADLELVDERGRVSRRWNSGKYHRLKFHLGWMTPHPTTYIRRAFFEEYGGFREDLSIAADYELMLRFFYRYRANVAYLPATVVRMLAGGTSNGSPQAILRANWQVYRSWRLNGMFTSPTIMLSKPLSKILQLRF